MSLEIERKTGTASGLLSWRHRHRPLPSSWSGHSPEEEPKKMSGNVSATSVAEWMAAQLEQSDHLFQETVAQEIVARFGKEFIYLNANGNLGVRKNVLTAFKKLTGDAVVWEGRARIWRKRTDNDKPAATTTIRP